jgi:hypothetical protein
LGYSIAIHRMLDIKRSARFGSMQRIRTTVTFQTPLFNTTEPRDYFINECCYGDDLARWMIQRLTARGIKCDAEPGQEDFGWYLIFGLQHTSYHLILGYIPNDTAETGEWFCCLERRTSLIGFLFGAAKRRIQPEAAEAVHKALSSSPEIHNIRWHYKDDFDAGREDKGANAPIGGDNAI